MQFKNICMENSHEINVPIELTLLCKYSWYSTLYFFKRSFFNSSVLGKAISFSFFKKYIYIYVYVYHLQVVSLNILWFQKAMILSYVTKISFLSVEMLSTELEFY